ncbi:glycosyltransferase [Methylobacterium fujisawaense]
MRIAIVTDEYVGIRKGGGIAVCSRGLAEHLARQGHEIHILLTTGRMSDTLIHSSDPELEISFSFVHDAAHDLEYRVIDAITEAYAVYQILVKQTYDVVHFNDWRGSGFYYAMARKQRAVNSVVVSHLHGPHKWVREFNQYMPSLEQLELEAIEFSQVENSDYVVSPSRYMLEWYKNNGIALPRERVINWLLPSQPKSVQGSRNSIPEARRPDRINELIFFGRHERRKGFELFVSAIQGSRELRDLKITFLGRFDRIDREFTGSYVMRKLPEHRGQIEFISDLDQVGAYKLLLERPNALCIMPSLIENSPCVVGECLELNIPFLATNVGGTRELLENASAAACLTAAEVTSLRLKIVNTVSNGSPLLASSYDVPSVRATWDAFHEEIAERGEHDSRRHIPYVAGPFRPLVSVCLVHHNRIELLKRALRGLACQTYKNFEVILVDDGSSEQQRSRLQDLLNEFPELSIKIILTENKYLGAARNTAAGQAAGELLIFHDDDNVSMPEQIEAFVKSIGRDRFDLLTSQYLVFEDQEGPEKAKLKYMPIGIGGPFSYFKNRFGDANCAIRRDVFFQCGGFSEAVDSGWEDYELFLKIYNGGFRIGVIPQPLFRYRLTRTGMLGSTRVAANYLRLINSISSTKSADMRDVVGMGLREQVERETVDKTWHTLENLPAGSLHRDLMALDPNSIEAKREFVKLMISVGRISDALRFAFYLSSEDAFLCELLFKMGFRSDENLSIASVQREFKPENEAALTLSGWLRVDSEEAPEPTRILFQGVWYEIVSWCWQHRPDVNSHLGLDGQIKCGFRAIAIARRRSVGTFADRLRVLASGLLKGRRGGDIKANFESAQSKIKVRFSFQANYVKGRLHIDMLKNGFISLCDIEGPKDSWFARQAIVDVWPDGPGLGLLNLQTAETLNCKQHNGSEKCVDMMDLGWSNRGDEIIKIGVFCATKVKSVRVKAFFHVKFSEAG